MTNSSGRERTADDFAYPQPETRDSGRETFFDTEFLRKLERLHLIAKRLSWAGAKGEHAASRKGFSLEFSDYRRYQHGDDLRYVDWNVYRRLDRLLVKVFTAEEEMNIYLLVDTSRSMAEGKPAKLDYAKKVAAALGYIGLKNLDRVGGASFSSRLHAPLDSGARQKTDSQAYLLIWTNFRAHGETNLRAAIHSFTNLFPHPGFVVIVSDLFDPAGWRAAFEELTAKRYQVLVIHIVDQQEVEPEPWGDVALVDVEERTRAQIFSRRRSGAPLPQRSWRAISKRSKRSAQSRKIDYLRTTTQVPFDEFVLQTLRQVSSVA